MNSVARWRDESDDDRSMSDEAGGKLRLLSFDDGGVRGLSTLFLLKHILSYVGSPKPHEFFHMIAGTGSGGLIAIMLGRLRMTIDKCIEHYSKLMHDIFHRKRFPLQSGRISARYATSTLEKHFRNMLDGSGLARDQQLCEEDPACKILILASLEAGDMFCFTNYQRPYHSGAIFDHVKIWEVVQATCSASGFFSSVDITYNSITLSFTVGRGHTNPVNVLWGEAEREYGISKYAQNDPGAKPLELQLSAILSLGIEKPALRQTDRSYARNVFDMCVESQQTHSTFQKFHPTLLKFNKYFRLDQPDLAEVGLDESNKSSIIYPRISAYCVDPGVEPIIKRFALSSGGPAQEGLWGRRSGLGYIETVDGSICGDIIDNPVPAEKRAAIARWAVDQPMTDDKRNRITRWAAEAESSGTGKDVGDRDVSTIQEWTDTVEHQYQRFGSAGIGPEDYEDYEAPEPDVYSSRPARDQDFSPAYGPPLGNWSNLNTGSAIQLPAIADASSDEKGKSTDHMFTDPSPYGAPPRPPKVPITP